MVLLLAAVVVVVVAEAVVGRGGGVLVMTVVTVIVTNETCELNCNRELIEAKSRGKPWRRRNDSGRAEGK